MKDILIKEKYRVDRKIGEGGFGLVYSGTDLQSGEEVAIKLTNVRKDPRPLEDEKETYEALSGGVGIPHIRWFGTECDFHVLVEDILGPSLEDLFNYCDRRFSLKTILLIADQAISRIEYIHSRGFLHRDIKPDNFLMGTGKQGNILFAIDFGLAKEHLLAELARKYDNRPFGGTTRYASINNHNGREQSWGDDLESLGYVLVYFARSSLPWQGLKAMTPKEKHELVKGKKMSLSGEDLCRDILPQEFATYINYTRSLGFNDKPNYGYLRQIFRRLFASKGFEYDNSRRNREADASAFRRRIDKEESSKKWASGTQEKANAEVWSKIENGTSVGTLTTTIMISDLSTSESSFLTLSDEILQLIPSYLTPIDPSNVDLVCKRFYCITEPVYHTLYGANSYLHWQVDGPPNCKALVLEEECLKREYSVIEGVTPDAVIEELQCYEMDNDFLAEYSKVLIIGLKDCIELLTPSWLEAMATGLMAQKLMNDAKRTYEIFLQTDRTLPERTLLTAAHFGWPSTFPVVPDNISQATKEKAIFGAAAGCNQEMVINLKKKGVSLDQHDGPMALASVGAAVGTLTLLKYLQDVGIDIVGNEVLHEATLSNQAEMVDFLLSMGARSGDPPFMVNPLETALGLGNIPLLRLFFKHTTSLISAKDAEGKPVIFTLIMSS
ncbi:hypothetical protein B7494_g1681 [Chlorociboria aeruginascens]|nr:hypothetical protein B7494_g1681 [Chlorociboria aeruginascens]